MWPLSRFRFNFQPEATTSSAFSLQDPLTGHEEKVGLFKDGIRIGNFSVPVSDYPYYHNPSGDGTTWYAHVGGFGLFDMEDVPNARLAFLYAGSALKTQLQPEIDPEEPDKKHLLYFSFKDSGSDSTGFTGQASTGYTATIISMCSLDNACLLIADKGAVRTINGNLYFVTKLDLKQIPGGVEKMRTLKDAFVIGGSGMVLRP